jgi:hypothetical protein
MGGWASWRGPFVCLETCEELPMQTVENARIQPCRRCLTQVVPGKDRLPLGSGARHASGAMGCPVGPRCD